MKKKKSTTKELVLSALFLAIGMVLPFVTAQVPAIGNALLPMHIPVILCGFICGWPYGLAVGFVLPMFRSMMFGMPMMFPTAIAMSLELATYGFCTGFLSSRLEKNWGGLYLSLVSSMVAGRIVWGIASFILYKAMGAAFTWKLFLVQGFANAIPGIVIQLILIPALVRRLAVQGEGNVLYGFGRR